MKILKTFCRHALIMAGLLGPALPAIASEDIASENIAGEDGVMASFDRAFSVRATVIVPSAPRPLQDDPLYRLVNARLWTPPPEERTPAWTTQPPVALSPEFDRLIHHDGQVQSMATNGMQKMYLYDYSRTGATMTPGGGK